MNASQRAFLPTFNSVCHGKTNAEFLNLTHRFVVNCFAVNFFPCTPQLVSTSHFSARHINFYSFTTLLQLGQRELMVQVKPKQFSCFFIARTDYIHTLAIAF